MAKNAQGGDELGSQTESPNLRSPNDAMSEEPQESLAGVKRRRTALACNPCRARKSRCNGARPKCELCVRMCFECTYDTSTSGANVIIRKDAFNDLEARLKSLEEEVRRHSEQLSSQERSSISTELLPSSYGGSVLSEALASVSVPSLPWESADIGAQSTVHTVGLDPGPEHNDTDGMAISFVDEQDKGFFGPSANISFMRIILRAVAGARPVTGMQGSPSSQTSIFDGGMVNINSFRSRLLPVQPDVSSLEYPNASPCILPRADIAENLIHEYFSNTGLLFPYIHKPSFIATYQQAKQSGFNGVRRTWLALLNVMFAMATRADPRHGDTARAFTESDTFYARAEELCRTQMLRGTTLETVQYLLLSSQYLQGTQRAVQTWTTHGLAVKAALSIGLHSQAALSKLPPLEQEMRKRTWFGCVILDRSLSMTFGRPSAIPEDYIRLPLPQPVVGDPENGASVLFFSATISLYTILWKVMARIYGHNVEFEDLSETELITRIIQLEQELVQWQNQLPRQLRLRTSASLPSSLEDPCAEKLRIVLTLRYFNTQLLLLRPVLTNLLQSRLKAGARTEDQDSISTIQKNLTTSCFKAAVEAISIIHAVITRKELGKHLLGAWWFTLYYAFNASLAVFSILILPMNLDDDNGGGPVSKRYQEGRATLALACDALLDMASENPLFERCVEHLRQLCRLLDNQASLALSRAQNLHLGAPEGQDALAVPHEGTFGDHAMFGTPFMDFNAMFEDEVSLGLLFNDESQARLDCTYPM